MFLQTVLRPRLQLVETPIGLGHADNRHVKIATLQHRLQRREDLLVRQVARGAEEYERIATIRCHKSSLSRLLFQMTAESESHCRQYLVLVVGFTARGESFIESGGQHRRGHALVDGGLDRPSALAGIGHPSSELL